MRRTLRDRDPLNKVPVEASQKRVQKGFPFKVPLILPRRFLGDGGGGPFGPSEE